jgi:hypothetical protein
MLLQIQMTGTQNVKKKKKIEWTQIFYLFSKRMMNF